MKNKNNESGKVKFPLGVKLAIIIGTIVLVSLTTVTILNSYFIGQDVQITAENSNLSVNSRAAETIEDKLGTIRSNTFQLLDLINVVSGGKQSALAKQAQAFFFERNQEIAAIYILSERGINYLSGNDLQIINNRFFISNELDSSILNIFLEQHIEKIGRSTLGETLAVNVSPFFEIPAMALMFPWKENGLNQTCVIIFSIENVSDILGSDSANTTFMINDEDEILCHPNTDRVLAGESMRNYELVSKMRQNNQNNADSRQIPFEIIEENGKASQYFGAYQKINIADIVILTTVGMDAVLEGVRTTRRNNIYLTGIVFFLSVILILCFSRFAISRHLRKLAAAADEIQKVNFNTELISSLNVNRKDEIGVLNRSTQNEIQALKQFSTYTNIDVVRNILADNVSLKGELKDITIFFSDIRGFTAISTGFNDRFGEDSGAKIIEFLNDYMGRMVTCVEQSHGNIDKFEGDAIMGIWGLLRNDRVKEIENLPDSDPEKAKLLEEHKNHVIEDSLNAVRGILAMRYSLMEYNKAAEAFTKEHANDANADYKPQIRIGCGINSGRATVGNMGAVGKKMEYTSIGDAVNFASRTEASNKPCGTDTLITQDTYDILKNRYIKCEENNFTILPENAENEIIVERIPVDFEVKGKGTQHFYGVVNMPQFDIEKFFREGPKGNPDFCVDPDCVKALGPKGPKTLNEVRTMLGIPIPDFEKVNLNEEENKIQVKK